MDIAFATILLRRFLHLLALILRRRPGFLSLYLSSWMIFIMAFELTIGRTLEVFYVEEVFGDSR